MRNRPSLRTRAVAIATGLGVAVSGSLLLASSAANGKTLSETRFGFKTTAYGTRVLAQDANLRSGRTAFSYISCTRLAGRSAHNEISSLSVPQDDPQIDVQGVSSTNRTFRLPKRHAVGVRGRSVIADAVIGDPNGAHVALQGLRTTATVQHRPSGWVTRTHITWDHLAITPESGTPLDPATQQLLDAVDQGVRPVLDVLDEQSGPVEIPGVGSIGFGWERRTGDKWRNRAAASAYALRIKLYGQDGVKGTEDDSLVALGRAWARMTRAVPAGVFHGRGYAARADLADGLVRVGRIATQPLPCEGTHGHVRVNDTAGTDLGNAGAVRLGALTGRSWGVQHRDGTARGWTEGRVGSVKLGTGDQKVVIKGIVGRANVRRTSSGKLVRTKRGSTVGSLTIGGDRRAVPGPGQTIEVPGLARITFFPTQRRPRGIRVTAVRIRLLDDSAGVSTLELGNAGAWLTRV